MHPVLPDDDDEKANRDIGPASFGQVRLISKSFEIDFVLSVSNILLSQVFEPLSAHRAMSAHGVDQVGFEERHILHAVRQHGTAHGGGNLVAVVAVVCVALMAFLLILGVVRIRASQRRAAGGEAAEEDGEAAHSAAAGGEMEMAWDDTPLNITVNPMEQVSEGRGNNPIKFGGSILFGRSMSAFPHLNELLTLCNLQGTEGSRSNGAMMPLAGSATGFANPSATSLATLRENPLQGWQHSNPLYHIRGVSICIMVGNQNI